MLAPPPRRYRLRERRARSAYRRQVTTEAITDRVAWYQLDAVEAAEQLGSGPEGISETEAERRFAEYGPNELEEGGKRSRWQIFAAQFRDLFTLILVAAAGISAFLGDWVEFIAILAIIGLNALMGYVQESKAEEALAALKKMAVPEVTVIRAGEPFVVSATSVVPGDAILIETGNVVPTDGRLLESVNLEVEEATLTGESAPVPKDASKVYPAVRDMADRSNVLFMGTTVSKGRGMLLTTDTGMSTELGKIADLIQGIEEERTPLQQRLDQLAKVLAVVALVIVALVFVIGVAQGEEIEVMLLTSVSLAVAAIPEAMPAVVTIALSLGAQRMLARQALIRTLPAVETLGSVQVIASDKTGTLTENRMTVTVLDVANQRLELSGQTHGPLQVNSPGADTIATSLQASLLAGALSNDAVLSSSGGETTAIGDPTETALVVAAAEFGLKKPVLERQLPRIDEVPFDSTRKRMTTVHRIETVPDSLVALAAVPAATLPTPRSPRARLKRCSMPATACSLRATSNRSPRSGVAASSELPKISPGPGAGCLRPQVTQARNSRHTMTSSRASSSSDSSASLILHAPRSQPRWRRPRQPGSGR